VQTLKATAEVSMGTELTELDLDNIPALATEVVSMSEYRGQLFDYLKNRMQAIAPNLTVMVGELVGARLIAHAGSLMNLAKQPASTVQILGAEKALFRALKTKHDTPKYGLIYHASLIGQTAPKHKGKISRVLAAKCALSIRVDALGEGDAGATVGYEGRAAVEMRVRQLEGGGGGGGDMGAAEQVGKYDAKAARDASAPAFSAGADVVQVKKDKKEKRKRDEDKAADSGAAAEEPKKDKKEKKEKQSKKEKETPEAAEPEKKKKKKDKKKDE
jgi:nucleolar protein 58